MHPSPRWGGRGAGSCWPALPPPATALPCAQHRGVCTCEHTQKPLSNPARGSACSPSTGGATAGAGATAIISAVVTAWGVPLGSQNQKGWFCAVHMREEDDTGRGRPCTQVSGGCVRLRSSPPSPSLLPSFLSAVRQPGQQRPRRGTGARPHLTPTPPSKKAPSPGSRRPRRLWSWIGLGGSVYPVARREFLPPAPEQRPPPAPHTPHLPGEGGRGLRGGWWRGSWPAGLPEERPRITHLAKGPAFIPRQVVPPGTVLSGAGE